jgi:tetratricopeptide (TPR) repeat protein
MTEQGQTDGKGKAFFERAEQVAGTGNWDFAIELYLEGIAREPGNIQRGHQALREVSLKRKAAGGKTAGLMDRLKRSGGRDPVQALCNAEYFLAKEPGNVSHMEGVLRAARNLPEPQPELVKWIADILLESQKLAKKPTRRVCQQLVDAYSEIEEFQSAAMACQLALQAAPDDDALQETLRDLSAKATLKKGRYGEEGDFTKGVRDLDAQQDLVQKDRLQRRGEYLQKKIEEARQAYHLAPEDPSRINALVDALLEPEEETLENEAMDVLSRAHEQTGTYSFKVRLGDIRIRQMTRRFRQLMAEDKKEQALQQARRQLAFELEEYTERALNYPTDLALKYELGRRQLQAGRLDDAIASLQKAQRDPKRHVRALTLLGQAFAKKQWYPEAVETFRRALESEMPEEREKELRYHLGDALEHTDNNPEALEEFSRVAQMDFDYKDVRQRVEALRNKTGKQQNE